MKQLSEHIAACEREFSQALEKVHTQQELESFRIMFLARNGKLALLMAELKNLTIEEKRVFGPQLNEFKQQCEERYTKKHEELLKAQEHQEYEQYKDFDVTAYQPNVTHGNLHIYTKTLEQLEDIFTSMGFEIVDGPEVETPHYNFEALNIPADHPARDMHDTFWLDVPNLLLRTHTSSIQAHAMEHKKLPYGIIAPGRCYRNEATDASHDFMFMQIEGLFIDKDVSLANLLATTKTFLQAFFAPAKITTRVRPGYFPFVEPGIEIDISCPFCTNGCSVCKRTTWIELLGAGLVHPNVLKVSNIDPEQYCGFAFGMGLERLIMIRYGINDIRLFHSSRLEFLAQF